MTCKDLEITLVCYNNGTTNETLVAHYEYGKNSLGNTILVSTRYTNAAGVVIDTTGGPVTAGACSQIQADVEFEKLCDVNAGVATEFFRRSITTFNSSGVPAVTVTDWELDKTTAYTPTGVVGSCNQDCDPATAQGVLTSWG